MASRPPVALLDLERLGAWLDSVGLAPGRPISTRRLTTGRSNEMFELERGDHHVMLRRPSGVALARADEGMRRECTVLRALDVTPVPHPRVIAMCDDPSVLGCVFYVMAWVEGFMPVGPLPPAFDGAEARRELAFAVIDALGELARVDWRAVGLADFGRPDDFHERQATRWLGQYQRYPRHELPGLDAIAAWLAAHRPLDWAPGIMHGDYHVANVLVAPDRPARVAAICDWELATIGDPLLDLAGFLRMWLDSHLPGDGWPTRAELVERYSQVTGSAVPDLTYHEVLARFRLAVSLEGIYQRSIDDPTRAVADDMHGLAARLVDELGTVIATS